MSDPNQGFIVAAYAVAFVTVAAMVIAIIADRVSLKRALAKLPPRGESGE